MTTPPTQTKNNRLYYLDTDEPVTGIVEMFNNDSQLWERQNYKDGEFDGLWEDFDRNGNLTKTETYRNGVLIEENNNP